MTVNFIKMNGAGNDFVVIDSRSESIALSPAQIRLLAARDNKETKGCDQLIIIGNGAEQNNSSDNNSSDNVSSKNNAADKSNAGSQDKGKKSAADIFMHIYNSDATEAGNCGNATRCIAWLLMEESAAENVTIQTKSGILNCKRAGNMRVTVDMGKPRFANSEIKLASGVDRHNIPICYGALKNGVAVGMGNPHLVYFVPTADCDDIEKYGAAIENNHQDIFPEKVNVSAAFIIDRAHIKLRVWERGAGLTLACGTAACATLVAASEKNLTERSAEIIMPGGNLFIKWRESDNHVLMSGPVALEFKGSAHV